MRRIFLLAIYGILSGGCPSIEPLTEPLADATIETQDATTEVGLDVIPDARDVSELEPDVAPDIVPDAVLEVTPDAVLEVTPDAVVEVAPDTLDETDSGCTQDSDCADTNTCTVDSCVAGVCANTVQTGAICDDGSACSISDTCTAQGECVGTAVVCDDDNECTSNGCDPSTGLCVASAVVDGQTCTSVLGCAGACNLGACECDCSDGYALSLDVEGTTQDTAGEYYLNKSGTATTLYNEPMSSAGPLFCPSDWLSGGAWLPQFEAYPLEIEWRRPCAGPDFYSDAANQYVFAGGTYWDAVEAGLTSVATFKVTDGSGQEVATRTLSDFHVVSVEPAFDECVDVQVVQIRGNKAVSKSIEIEVEGLGTFGVGAFGIAFKTTSVPLFSDPYDWDSSVVPSGGGTATVQLQSPCGTAGTDSVFGFNSLNTWASGGQASASVIFKGVNAAEMLRLNLFDAEVSNLGTCESGSRTTTITVVLAQNS